MPGVAARSRAKNGRSPAASALYPIFLGGLFGSDHSEHAPRAVAGKPRRARF